VPTIITPNDDGINDVFFIPCLSADLFPGNKVSVFNQWGGVVLEESPYSNNWQGTYKGQDLPVGTYFYIVEFGNGQAPKTGFLMIKR
jgi:gliding motility-associated-like protein